jgi:hypothetical protein
MAIIPFPPAPLSPADQQAQEAEYYRRLLHDLIDIGAELARLLHQQAKAKAAAPAATPSDDPAPGPAIPALAIAFDRIARAVRRTITLARKVAEPAALAQQPAQHPAEHRAAARRRIIREVEDAIQRTRANTDAESLNAEFFDRLDGPDLDDDIQHRPIADVIAEICRDLGLAALPGTQPWKRRTAADVAALCSRAAAARADLPVSGHPMPAQPGADPSSADLPGVIPLHGPPVVRPH